MADEVCLHLGSGPVNSSIISRHAPAKINLALHVVGQRADNFHLLESLVTFTEIGDRITVRPANELTLKIVGQFSAKLSADKSNLVLRAAHALQHMLQRDGLKVLGASILLEKNLPIASGIGGGSADAAATLLALAELWDVAVEPEKMKRLAAHLSADIPMCLLSKPLIAKGVGDEISPVSLPILPLVLVNSGIEISTPTIFSSLADKSNPGLPDLPKFENCQDVVHFLEHTRNDLQNPAIAHTPEISSVIDVLMAEKGCLLASMSGSGATCFGIFADQASAEHAALNISKLHTDWWISATNTL